jgi:hypothetical protein
LLWPSNIESIKSLPIDVHFFDDGLYVVGGDGAGRGLTGRRILAIGNRTTEQIVATLPTLITHDNELGILGDANFELPMMTMLRALGAATNDTVALTLEGHSAGSERIPLVAQTGLRAEQLARPEKTDSTLLFFARPQDNYWFTRLPASNVVYMQFNAVASKGDENISVFAARLRDSLRVAGARTLIIDVRRNNGGDSFIFKPLLASIVAFEQQSAEHRVFILISRSTASAAVNFVSQIAKLGNPMFVGEPTYEGPNFTGDAWRFRLPFSRTWASISYRNHVNADWLDSRPWIVPQIPVHFTSTDYFANRDPVLQAALDVIHVRR